VSGGEAGITGVEQQLVDAVDEVVDLVEAERSPARGRELEDVGARAAARASWLPRPRCRAVACCHFTTIGNLSIRERHCVAESG